MSKPDYLDTVLNIIKENIVAFDTVGTITYVNKSFADLLRPINSSCSTVNIVGKNIWKLLPQLVETSLYKNVVESIKRQEIRLVEWKSPFSDKFWETTIYPSDKSVTAIGRDITKRKKAEETLLSKERELASIYSSVPEILFFLLVKPDGVFVSCLFPNPSCR